MQRMTFLLRLLPQDTALVATLGAAGHNLVEAAQVLVDLAAPPAETEIAAWRLRRLEHRGDELTHEIHSMLTTAVVVPWDRALTRELAGRLDDVVDGIEEVVRRLWLYQLGPLPLPGQRLAHLVRTQAELLAASLPQLRYPQPDLLARVAAIHQGEAVADDVLDAALATLFTATDDLPAVIAAIRWGELYQGLEATTDCAARAADLLERIVREDA